MSLIGKQRFSTTKCGNFVAVFDEFDAKDYFLNFENVAVICQVCIGPLSLRLLVKGKGSLPTSP